MKEDSESAWESNPPATLVTPPTRFEDEGHHRATSALARKCSSLAIPVNREVPMRRSVLHPLGVEAAWPVDALVCMRTEIVALRLNQVRGQSRAAVGVEVGQ
jgi:hypothetical protein